MAFKIIPDGTQIPFLKFRYAAASLSAALLLGSIILLFVQGLNFGIDFTGGAMVQVQTGQVQEVATLRKALKNAGEEGVTIQEYGSQEEFIIRLPLDEGTNTADHAETVRAALAAEIGQVEIRRVEFVGPQIGAELREKGVLAILISLVVILIYVSMRFEMRYGIGAIVALAHDVLLTVGVFALIQKEVTLPVLAALLTIIGYSLNDTIVVFDRIRENRAKTQKAPLVDVLNRSLNQTLGRTIMTSLTTLIVLLALYFRGGEAINDFAFTLLFGVLVGTYSSVFIASPVLLLMENYYKRMAEEEAKRNEKSSSKEAL